MNEQRIYKINYLVNTFGRDAVLLERSTNELQQELDDLKEKHSAYACKVCGDIHGPDDLGCDDSDWYNLER